MFDKLASEASEPAFYMESFRAAVAHADPGGHPVRDRQAFPDH